MKVLVTGAGRAIGRVVTEQLLAADALVRDSLSMDWWQSTAG